MVYYNISPIHNTLSSLLLLRRCDLFFAFHFSGKKVCAPPPLFGAELRHCIYITRQYKSKIKMNHSYTCNGYRDIGLHTMNVENTEE